MCWGHSLSYSKRLKRGDLFAVKEVVLGAREHELPVLQTLRGLFVSPLVPRALLGAARSLRDSGSQQSWLSADAQSRLGVAEHIASHSVSDKTHDAVFAARYNALRWSSTIHSVRSHAMVARDYGIEVSHPFFDQRIAEFSFAIPDDLWLREGQPKWLLRRAMQGTLPDQLLNTRKKVVFDDFFFKLLERNQQEVRETLLHEHLYDLGIADRSQVLKAFEDSMSKKCPFHVDLLYAVQLQSWLSRHA
jgi:asparagine synthase (glutamine-hydrolysing)